MRAMPRFTLFILIAVTALIGAGCGEEPASASGPELPAGPPEPKVVTTGRVVIALPGYEDAVPEIICLPELTAAMQTLIKRQQADLSAFLFPPEPEEATVDDGVVSAEDREKLEEKIAALRETFPAPVVSQFNAFGEGRKYESRHSLRARYEPLVAAVNVEDFEVSLNAISTLMQDDYALLDELSKSKDEREANQARADINWLAALSEWLQGFKPIVKRYDSARRRQMKRLAEIEEAAQVTPPPPEQVWQKSQADLGPELEIELYKTATGSVYVDEGNRFEVGGSGALVARINVEGVSVFLAPDGPGGEHIRLEEVTTAER